MPAVQREPRRRRRSRARWRGSYLVELNLDDWHDKLKTTGFAPRKIPLFYLVGADGRPTGKMIDGDKWGRSTVASMSATLRGFLAP